MRRGSASALSVGAAVAAVLSGVVAPPASGADPGPWVQETTAAFWEVTASVPGRTPGRVGNWHTVLVNIEMDDDGLTGWVRDWRCPQGTEPPAPHTDSSGSACTLRAAHFLDDSYLYDDTGVAVRWTPRLRYVRATGDVNVSDAAGSLPDGFVRLVGRSRGPYTQTETVEGDYRTLEQSREGVRARGRVLGVRLGTPGATVDAGPLSVYSTYRRVTPAG